MRFFLVTPTLRAFLISATLAGSALAAEPELPTSTATLRKQCIGYGYKAGTDALAECVMKLDLMRQGGQATVPQVAAPLPNKPPAPTPAPPVNKIVEPTVATKPIPVATPTPAKTPTPAAATIEATAPVPPAAPPPASTTVQTTAPAKPAEVASTLAKPDSSVALEKATEIDQKRLAQVKSLAVIAIRDPTYRVITKALLNAALAQAACGILCTLAVDSAYGAGPSSGREAVIAATDALTHSSLGSGEALTIHLMRLMQENGYVTERIVEQRSPQSGDIAFFKSQKSKSDGLLHITFAGLAQYKDEEDKLLRPRIDVLVTLAASKYGNTLFKSHYRCPNTTSGDTFAFTDAMQIKDNISRASEGFTACMKEIATDVAATLKRPVAPPPQ